MSLASRVSLLLAGFAWAGRSLLEVVAHPRYWAPVTPIDWIAVWSYSAAWLLLAPALIVVALPVGGRSILAVATIAAFGAIAAGIANGLEDGFGVKVLGTVYVVGSMTALLGLAALAVLVYRAGHRPLAGLVIGLGSGLFLFVAGGGVIVLAVLAAVALKPELVAPSSPGRVATQPLLP